MSKVYYLDEDCNANIKDKSKPFCIRCHKEIKDLSKAVKVEFVDDWNVYESSTGKFLLGMDCWNKVRKL